MTQLVTESLEREGEPFRGWLLFSSEKVVVRIKADAAPDLVKAEQIEAVFEVKS